MKTLTSFVALSLGVLPPALSGASDASTRSSSDTSRSSGHMSTNANDVKTDTK